MSVEAGFFVGSIAIEFDESAVIWKVAFKKLIPAGNF